MCIIFTKQNKLPVGKLIQLIDKNDVELFVDEINYHRKENKKKGNYLCKYNTNIYFRIHG